MRFGIFAAPFHPHDQNPTLHFQSDLDLVVRLDELGYDEAWIGEHHSGGWEMVGSPELFCAVAAERSKHIKLYVSKAVQVQPSNPSTQQTGLTVYS